MENIVKKAGKRLYMLYQLKRAEIIQKDMISVYITGVRPVKIKVGAHRLNYLLPNKRHTIHFCLKLSVCNAYVFA